MAEIPDDKRCQHIGYRSCTQCTKRRLRGSDYCRAHDRTPLPEGERTPALDIDGEIEACSHAEKPEPASRHISREEFEANPSNYFVVAPGTARESYAPRCQAKSKRTGLRCNGAACRGKRVCRIHGGASRGPKNTENCGKHFYKHGRETQAIRRHRKQKNAEFRVFARIIKEYGV